MNIWQKLAVTRSPEDITSSDWKKLHEIVSGIVTFESENEGERTAPRAKRLLNILGFSSFKDLEKQNKINCADTHLVIEFERARIDLQYKEGKKISIAHVCETTSVRNYEGKYLTDQHLKNEIYEARARLGIPTGKEADKKLADFFEDYMHVTPEKDKNSRIELDKIKKSMAKYKIKQQ